MEKQRHVYPAFSRAYSIYVRVPAKINHRERRNCDTSVISPGNQRRKCFRFSSLLP